MLLDMVDDAAGDAAELTWCRMADVFKMHRHFADFCKEWCACAILLLESCEGVAFDRRCAMPARRPLKSFTV